MRFVRFRTATDLDEEFRLHIDQREDDPVRGGMTRWQLGNAGRLRESGQEIKSWVWLESLLRDFRFGFRMIVKYRTASMAAIVSLALALGACTAAFTLVDALVFRPLPG